MTRSISTVFEISDHEAGLSEEVRPRAGGLRSRLQGLGADEALRLQLVGVRSSKNQSEHLCAG